MLESNELIILSLHHEPNESFHRTQGLTCSVSVAGIQGLPTIQIVRDGFVRALSEGCEFAERMHLTMGES